MGNFIPWNLFSNFIDKNFPKNHYFFHITLLIDKEIPVSNCRSYGGNQYVLELDARDKSTMFKDENNALRYLDFITKEEIVQISSDYEYLYTIPYSGGTKFNILGFNGIIIYAIKNRLPTPVKKNPYTKILKQGGWTPIQKLRYESDRSVEIEHIEFLIDTGTRMTVIQIDSDKDKYLYARYILGMYVEIHSKKFKLSYIMYDDKGYVETNGERAEMLFIGYRNLRFKE